MIKTQIPEEGVEGRGTERWRGTCPLVLKNAKTLRCSRSSIPFVCRKRDGDTIIPDNPYKLARSLLIKFIELIRAFLHNIAVSAIDLKLFERQSKSPCPPQEFYSPIHWEIRFQQNLEIDFAME